MINVLAISSLWATVDARVEKYNRVDTETKWEIKAVRRKGVALLVEINRSLLQTPRRLSQTDRQENLTPRLSLGIELPTLFEQEAHWLQSHGAERGQP